MVQKRIASVVVLYQPPESVPRNIATYLDGIDLLYVFDNSPDSSREVMECIRSLDKIRYLTLGKNVGIAVALNVAAQQALQEGFDYLLTMDQDSAANEGMIQILFDCAESHPKAGLVSPFHQDRNAPPQRLRKDFELVPIEMTSGNLINLAAYKNVGGFLEKLFIDCVDIEFCLRLQLNGFSVVRANQAVLSHTLGHRTQRQLFGRTVFPSNHSPARLYYQMRNRSYVRRIYGRQFSEYFKHDTKTYWRGVAKIMLYEEHRFKKLVMILRGYLAFLRKDFSNITIA